MQMSEWKTFSETRVKAPSLVTWAYLRLVFTLMTTINAAPFRGLPPGACMLRRVTCSPRQAGDALLTYTFAEVPTAERQETALLYETADFSLLGI